MMQGDSYSLDIEILDAFGTAITDAEVSNVEITIGHLRKTYADGEVKYDSSIGAWKFPMTQDETFRYPPARVRGQVRLVWKNGDVEGITIEGISVKESISREVL